MSMQTLTEYRNILSQHAQALQNLKDEHRTLKDELAKQHASDLKLAEARFQHDISEIKKEHKETMTGLKKEHKETMTGLKKEHKETMTGLKKEHKELLQEVKTEKLQLQDELKSAKTKHEAELKTRIESLTAEYENALQAQKQDSSKSLERALKQAEASSGKTLGEIKLMHSNEKQLITNAHTELTSSLRARIQDLQGYKDSASENIILRGQLQASRAETIALTAERDSKNMQINGLQAIIDQLKRASADNENLFKTLEASYARELIGKDSFVEKLEASHASQLIDKDSVVVKLEASHARELITKDKHIKQVESYKETFSHVVPHLESQIATLHRDLDSARFAQKQTQKLYDALDAQVTFDMDLKDRAIERRDDQISDLEHNYEADEDLIEAMRADIQDYKQTIVQLKDEIAGLKLNLNFNPTKPDENEWDLTLLSEEADMEVDSCEEVGILQFEDAATQPGAGTQPGVGSQPTDRAPSTRVNPKIKPFKILLGDGNFQDSTALPKNARAKLENQMREWESDWDVTAKASAYCARARMKSTQSPRHADHPRATCAICIVGRVPCINWDLTLKTLLVYPLAPEDREGKTPADTGYWIWEGKMSKRPSHRKYPETKAEKNVAPAN